MLPDWLSPPTPPAISRPRIVGLAGWSERSALERRRITNRAYRARNRDRINARKRELYAATPFEKRRRNRPGYLREWYARHREEVAARLKRWRELNPERWQAIRRKAMAKWRAKQA